MARLENGGIVAETLADRITMRLKRVAGVDRRLLMEAREELLASSAGVDAQAVWDWLEENDIKLMTWQVKRLGEMGANVG